MSPTAIATTIFLGTLAAAGLGILLHARLPEHHLNSDSRDVVKNVMGLIATVAALVLGLLIASAHASYDTLSDEIDQMAANTVEMDRALATYGPEAAAARALFRSAVRSEVDRVWPNGGVDASTFTTVRTLPSSAEFAELIMNLEPRTDAQRFLQRRVLELAATSGRTRVLIFNQLRNGLPMPFLMVLIFWLVVLFLGFGLFARLNATVLVALGLGSMSVAGAMFLILELNRPFDGLMRISDASMRSAIGQFGP